MRKSGRTNAWVQESFMKYWNTKNSKVAWSCKRPALVRMTTSLRILKDPIWMGIPRNPDVERSSKHQHHLSQKFMIKNRLWKIVTLRLISKVAWSWLRHLYEWLRAWGYWRIRFGGQIPNWIQGNLFPFELEIEYENNVETDWNSPPIYDEYRSWCWSFWPKKREYWWISSSQQFRLFMPKWKYIVSFIFQTKFLISCSENLFTCILVVRMRIFFQWTR